LHIAIGTNQIGAQRDGKDSCYVQIMSLWPKITVDRSSFSLAGHILSASAVICCTYIVEKIEFQTIDSSSIYFKGEGEPLKHWKIKRFMCIPWDWAGFGGDMLN